MPAPKPHYAPATLVVYDAEGSPEFLGGKEGDWGVPVPAPLARPDSKPNPSPDHHLNPPSPNSAANAMSVLRNAQRAQKTQQTGQKPSDTAVELAIGTGLGLGIVEKEQPKAEQEPVKEKVVEVKVRIPGAFVTDVEDEP